MIEEPSQADLEAMHCWEQEDRVGGRPAMTAFRRAVRLDQARWRDAHSVPIGSQPIGASSTGRARVVGSRVDLAHARATGVNFITEAARAAATTRAEVVEPHQRLDSARVWADLLSPVALSFNLFGDLAADHRIADHVVRRWWPDVPGTVSDVRFEHSPGRLDPAYLGNLSTLGCAVVLEVGAGTKGIVGIDVRYHERAKGEVPKPRNLARYCEVADRSGVFRPGYRDAVVGELTVMWLQHLLVLSMVQHPEAEWSWGRFVVAHAAGNTDYADLCARYRDLLRDDSTFRATTIEELLAARALPKATVAAVRERYFKDR